MKTLRSFVPPIVAFLWLVAPHTACAGEVTTPPAEQHAAGQGVAPGEKHAGEQGPAPGEARAEVPELTEFHGVIRRLWHDAWPNRQMDSLRAMLPDIQAGAAKVAAAKLPGILHERQEAWDAAVKRLEAVVADYAAAVADTSDQKLLDAGEALHSQFEEMVRVVRPALREMNDFHVVLYKLYHYDLPASDRAAIRESVEKLREPMTALNKAKLPPRLEAKQKEFDAARKKLSAAVDRLVAMVKAGNDERIRKAIEDMHERYETLAGVFD